MPNVNDKLIKVYFQRKANKNVWLSFLHFHFFPFAVCNIIWFSYKLLSYLSDIVELSVKFAGNNFAGRDSLPQGFFDFD